jgi:HSP20 family molecular chaperone IbpA
MPICVIDQEVNMLLRVHSDPGTAWNGHEHELKKRYGDGSTNISQTSAFWAPQVDLIEEQNAYVLYLDVSGVSPDAIDVMLEDGVLAIKGTRPQMTSGETAVFQRLERCHGPFECRFRLPDEADCESITATGHHGVLTIRIQKRKEVQARKIAVRH